MRATNNSPRHNRNTLSTPWPPGFPPPQMKLRIDNCPPGTTTVELNKHFSRFGEIDFIRVEAGETGKAFLAFSPPPRNIRDFFAENHTLFDPVSGSPFALRLTTLDFHNAEVASPLDPRRKFPTHITLHSSHMRVGVMTGEQDMMGLRGGDCDDQNPILIKAHLKDPPEIKIQFTGLRHGQWQALQIRSHFSNIATIHKASGYGSARIMVLTFKYPPKVFALPPSKTTPLTAEDQYQWSKNQHFRRVTDIDTDMRRRDQAVTALVRHGHEIFIDPGRWLTWSFTFKKTDFNEWALPCLLDMFSAYNVVITNGEIHNRAPDRQSLVWHAFDLDNHVKPSFGSQRSALQTLQAQSDGFPVLQFEVRYALEVCFSKGLLYEGSITSQFLSRLSNSRGADLLENLMLTNKKLYNPMQLFELPELGQKRKRRVPKTCILMHSVTVTPTTMYVQPVQVEVSNRVIRKYIEHADRFLRVRFSDEAYFGRLQSQRDDREAEVYDRVRRTLVNGVRVAGRHYDFLACGNSQFRENGAYFFNNNESVSVNGIRQWMGYFQHIREIPKYVSRIGQCFSTTRAVTSIGLKPEIVEIPDIERNGFTFTDGVGKLSKFLAHMISQELRLGPDAPSLFQFRMGGCKGVLAVDPTLSGREVHIRPSQQKFKTDYNQLEIIRWSSFASAYLNRQIILVLSALGISDTVFVRKMKVQLAEINRALEDNDTAISMLQASVDFNQVSLAIARMIQAGLRNDPFVDSMLHLWRAWMKKSLKEKANMFIPEGAFVLGCVDETATLRMDPDKLPEIFLQVPDLQNGGKVKVVEAICIIVRNPALHPGDIRVVRAVDCEKLRHLENVVVVPQLGARDLANMCAGGDLDGDDFLVIWDRDLIPPQHNCEPMDYSAPAPIVSKGPVTQSDIISFFCDYMKNDSLGNIAVAHRAWADYYDAGVKHEKCVELAQLHSQAVDYCKTGVPARMHNELKVQTYPHWLEKPKGIPSYHSLKILGRLYDEVDRVDFKPNYGPTFDERILDAYDIPQELFEKAYALKTEYDIDMRRIMAQFGITTEFEVWSAFVMFHNREVKLYKFAEEVGRLMSMLKHEYRDLCYKAAEIVPNDRDMSKLGPMVAALYQVTAHDVAAFKDTQPEKTDSVMDEAPAERQPPMISFPWIFQEELLGIATMNKSGSSLSEAMILNILAAKNWRAGSTRRGDRASSMQHHLLSGTPKSPVASSRARSQSVATLTPDNSQQQSKEKAQAGPRSSVTTIDALAERFAAASRRETKQPHQDSQLISHSSKASTDVKAMTTLRVQTVGDNSSSGSNLTSPIGRDNKTSRSHSPTSSVSSGNWSNHAAASMAGTQSLQGFKPQSAMGTIEDCGVKKEEDMIDFDDEPEEEFDAEAAGQAKGPDAFKQLKFLVGM
ncbi:RNA-dependent RNA polymerase 1 [Sphaceloma murrayae]|uniref:RNA-dependent RNA polymerase n=1 Tax=Sphaceloma murrayae TaxID=2082308 RepID=A0A2K1QM95_9PEZI|nr:RNA-dependent RNA polymerase 1 [Sphaceloma murrayae]